MGRKKRYLGIMVASPNNEDDIRHVCKVITAISKTLEIQKEIDRLYPGIERNLIKLN